MRKPGCNIWSKSWALMILTTFMKNWMCDQQLKPPSNESWHKISVDLITLDLSNICFWYWVVFVLGSVLYLSLDLYCICLWIYVIFAFGSMLYSSLSEFYLSQMTTNCLTASFCYLSRFGTLFVLHSICFDITALQPVDFVLRVNSCISNKIYPVRLTENSKPKFKSRLCSWK